MKKIAILLALLALCFCIVPCYAEEADDSIVMDQDILLISPAPTDDTTTVGSTDEPTDITVESESAIEFHPENFMSSLSYMGTGMIGIFIVIGLIVLATVVLNKLFREKSDKAQ